MADNKQKKDVCYVCQKKKYTLVFYERRREIGRRANAELLEIKDEEFLRKCRSEYRLKYSQDSKTRKPMTTPLICGTLVREQLEGEKLIGEKNITNMTFNRKLRMMRADVYSLVSISTDSSFFAEAQHQQLVKVAALKFLEGEFNERVKKQGVFARLQGWNKLLHQKCNRNQILQIHSINQPECVQDPEAPMESDGSDHYVFAELLDPGFHQLIIYDPELHKAFCKEFIVDYNHQQVLYPELPKLIEQ